MTKAISDAVNQALAKTITRNVVKRCRCENEKVYVETKGGTRLDKE